jgi:uncharacterized membrane protein
MPPDSPPRSSRLDSIDVVRGLVMVLMALDHARDFFGSVPIGVGINLFEAYRRPELFLTRWVTHFCAPTFVLLAGTGAFLAGSHGRSRTQLAMFLLTRGLWLIVLEHTLIHFLWFAQWDPSLLFAQVIYAIGASFIVLALLVWLPARAIGLIGVVIVGMHNLFDGLPLREWGPAGNLLSFLFQFEFFEYAPRHLWLNIYPVMPWFGILAIGYGLGPHFLKPAGERRRNLFLIGLIFTALFIALRYSNVYGDPRSWRARDTTAMVIMDGLNCQKYPPSLDFVLMTIGPMLMLLAILPDRAPRLLQPLVTFGRVPLFFYLAHLLVLHLGAAGMNWYLNIEGPFVYMPYPNGPALNLGQVYIAWIAALLVLYFPCRWFAGLKRRHPGGVLSYL